MEKEERLEGGHKGQKGHKGWAKDKRIRDWQEVQYWPIGTKWEWRQHHWNDIKGGVTEAEGAPEAPWRSRQAEVRGDKEDEWNESVQNSYTHWEALVKKTQEWKCVKTY